MITAYQAEFDADIELIAKSASHIDQLYAQWRELSEDKLSIPKAKRTDWRTPAWLFNELNKEFRFDIDIAASAENAKCKHYYTLQQNALIRDWWRDVARALEFNNAFLNPPFDKATEFLQKALEQRQFMRNIVSVLPYRAGTRWFRDLVHTPLFAPLDGNNEPVFIVETQGAYYYGFASSYGQLRILTKRLAFDDGPKVAAFDCCVVVFRGLRPSPQDAVRGSAQ